jgi:GT2 family glycosyltransferase
MYSSIFIASQIWLSIRIKLGNKPETRSERPRNPRFAEIEPIEDVSGGETMLTSIVIITYNKLDYTKLCIESIRKHTAPDSYEMIVVDNHSSDETVSWLREQPDIVVIYNDFNAGFPAACNQGIGIAKGDAILLLNNDTVVTARWLENMLIALHSDPQIGAVGTVTNSCSYYQTIPAMYKNMEGMQLFAEAFNRSNPILWEERLKLVGYNMLIKRHILDEIGELDERFTPGNCEDDDLSYRIRRAGYRLLLCKDTFIHHYGSVSFGERAVEFNKLINSNRQKFMDKWGFHPDRATEIRSDLVDRIPGTAADAAPHVLEIGCGLGGTLLKIKDKFPEAVLYGADANGNAAEGASLVCSAPVYTGTAEQALELHSPASLDVVILHNTFHSLHNPISALHRCRETLREGGVLLAVVPNIFQPSTLFRLLDNSIRRDELLGMASPEIRDWLSKAGFENIEVTGIYNSATTEDRQFMESVASLRGTEAPVNYNFREFVVRAVRSHA